MTATDTNTKRGFDFARGNLWMVDPVDDVCIVGGADTLSGDESSTNDTETDKTHPLYDPRLEVDLDDEFVKNVDAFGIITPIVIARIGDVACVVAGRRRVRAARIVSRNRARTGQPLLKVPCTLRRSTEVNLLGAMIAENEARVDDSPLAKLEKFKRYLDRGVSVEDAAVTFNVKPETARGWVAFDDHASDELRALLAAGKITFYAALRIARLKDPAKQHAAILDAQGAINGGDDDEDGGEDDDGEPAARPKKIGYSKASNSAKKTRAGHANDSVGVREMKKMLESIESMSHGNAGKETLAWWEGVEDTLRFLLGADGEMDARLVKALADARSAAKASAKKRAAAKK